MCVCVPHPQPWPNSRFSSRRRRGCGKRYGRLCCDAMFYSHFSSFFVGQTLRSGACVDCNTFRMWTRIDKAQDLHTHTQHTLMMHLQYVWGYRRGTRVGNIHLTGSPDVVLFGWSARSHHTVCGCLHVCLCVSLFPPCPFCSTGTLILR